MNKSTWVVTLFGEWRAQRNRRCLEDPNGSLVYPNKPFSDMTDDYVDINVLIVGSWTICFDITLTVSLIMCNYLAHDVSGAFQVL